MKIFVEVVDDFECFSPSLLVGYPITEMGSKNLFVDPQDYAREHKLTPIRLVHNTSNGSYDHLWAFESGPLTHRVYRVDHLPYIVVTKEVPVSPWLFAPHYDLEGVLMPLGDAKRAAIRIMAQWEWDAEQAKSAGLWDEHKDDIEIKVDGEVQDETI